MLWDAGQCTSAEDLIRLLKSRFGSLNEEERYRSELKARRRRRGESLQSVYQDVRRLMSLAFPGHSGTMWEIMARDAFVESLGDPGLRLRVLERDPTTLEEALKVASRLEALGYGELEHDWDDVGRRRDKFVKTTVGSENHGEQQLTGMIQDLKKELAENRMELERLRKDQFSYWRGSGCVAGTPGEAYAEPGRPAQFLDHQFADMSVGSWRATPTPPAPPSVPFTGFNMLSPPPS